MKCLSHAWLQIRRPRKKLQWLPVFLGLISGPSAIIAVLSPSKYIMFRWRPQLILRDNCAQVSFWCLSDCPLNWTCPMNVSILRRAHAPEGIGSIDIMASSEFKPVPVWNKTSATNNAVDFVALKNGNSSASSAARSLTASLQASKGRKHYWVFPSKWKLDNW